jgi:glucose/arabinose dehydrogenase/mono/diheme cytochrome c family protein
MTTILNRFLASATLFFQLCSIGIAQIDVNKNDTISLIGSGMGSRMIHYGHFETEIFLRFPNHDLTIRNLCDEGNTPGFRPHPSREQIGQYAFPNAKELIHKSLQANTKPKGHFPTPDQWLANLKTDILLCFFGFNSSFDGPNQVDRFKNELDAFLKHAKSTQYDSTNLRIALISPTAVQAIENITNGRYQNRNLKVYVDAMRKVAQSNNVMFIDAFTPSLEWYKENKNLSIDGALYNDDGYKKLASFLANSLFKPSIQNENLRNKIHNVVIDKNFYWLNDFKVPNGVHVYGRRYNPFGPQNYPFEIEKTREYTRIRDEAIWATLKGQSFDIKAAEAKSPKLPNVPTNYLPPDKNSKNGNIKYTSGPVAETKIDVAEGYKIELFADEKTFPDLANPVQVAFDNKGRLWVATMASYPHYRIGDPLPTDKLIIFEDTNNDGKADKQINFADDLHIPIGFEIAHDGVYVSQSGSLVFLQDTDGDDKYDKKEVLLSGFDDHDTHHAISSFSADPSGAIIMCEGVFLHSHVETAFGPQRGSNGGFFRYDPRTRRLIRHAQFNIPNPWGVAVDEYGQELFLHTSGTKMSWMLPGMVKARYGANIQAPDLITSNKVRPTSGIEFVSSRHFPDEVQGDILINNNIGFLGAKQHKVIDQDPGYTTEYRHDLFVSKDLNFRPTDLEFAPDGSLYVVDWQNALIGHMQHNARDPNRDHKHGRIYRITYPSRPLVKPAKIHGASISELLKNLELPELRTRYRTRRELRGHNPDNVAKAAAEWSKDKSERLKLEALWVTWGAGKVNTDITRELLKSSDHRIRSAALNVLRFNINSFKDHEELLLKAANDSHGRVRMSALVAGTYMYRKMGSKILKITEDIHNNLITEIEAKLKANEENPEENAEEVPVNEMYKQTYVYAREVINRQPAVSELKERTVAAPPHLDKEYAELYKKGSEVYSREGHCITCHQGNGKGLPDSGFPPLSETKWVTGNSDRLIKLTLKGLMGPIEVLGKKYPGQVPMTPFEHMLKDDEIAAVLTYIRNSFGNKADPILPEQVEKIRAAKKDFYGLYSPEKLLSEHPME